MTAAALSFGFAVYRWIEQPLLRGFHRWQPRRQPSAMATDASIVPR